MKRLVAAALLGPGLLASAPAPAGTRVHEAARVTLTVPDGWRVRGGEDRLTAAPPDEGAAITVLVVAGRSLPEILAGLRRELARSVQDLAPAGGPRERTVGGLASLVQRARGRLSGRPVELRLQVVRTPSGKVLVMVALVASDLLPRYQAPVEQVLASPAPAR